MQNNRNKVLGGSHVLKIKIHSAASKAAMMRVNLVLPEGYAFKWQTIRRKLRTRFEHDSLNLTNGF